MSFSKKVAQPNDTKLNPLNKATTLNPNAAEFVPFSLRSPSLSSPSGSTSKTADAAVRIGSSGNLGKAVLDRTESSVSNASDEEARQFWSQQLPDDITPDFKMMSEDESQGLGGIALASLSVHDNSDVSRFSASTGGGYLLTEQQQQQLGARHMNGSSFGEKIRYAASYGDDLTSASFLNLPIKPWDKQVINNNQLLGRDLHPFNESQGHGFMIDILGEHQLADENAANPLEFLATQFPGFAAESLAEVYVANGCDLNLTVEMLTQLELQVDGGFYQNISPKTLSTPNLSAMDFPALTAPESQNGPSKLTGDDLQQAANPYRSSDKDNLLLFKSGSSFESRGATDFAAAVQKMASQDCRMWKYERNGSANSSVGSSRSSQVLASSYGSGQERGFQSHGTSQAAPAWVETGESVANMYSELREEAHDHTRFRNAYFEQARQAFLIGNKALAKELSAKGQMHNMHMKAAHGKAQESIYRQRNPEMQLNGRGNERMIDLHGLHVSEAIHVLKHELSALRSAARLAAQRLQVYILVGTGHHTKGARTPARLPITIQRYLLEEELLEYTEPQPGLLRVVIY